MKKTNLFLVSSETFGWNILMKKGHLVEDLAGNALDVYDHTENTTSLETVFFMNTN